MKLTINIDFRTWVQVGQVGSSIHGELLKPNDVDICISIKLPLITKFLAKTMRIGKYNLIFLHGVSLHEYYESFDMGILKGYKSIFNRKLHLTWAAQRDLQYKRITQFNRNCDLFVNYDPHEEKQKQIERAIKYKNKLPEGWTIYLLPYVQRKLDKQVIV